MMSDHSTDDSRRRGRSKRAEAHHQAHVQAQFKPGVRYFILPNDDVLDPKPARATDGEVRDK